MTKAIKLILCKAIEDKMLKIYATIVTVGFLSIWIPAMVAVVKEFIRTFL